MAHQRRVSLSKSHPHILPSIALIGVLCNASAVLGETITVAVAANFARPAQAIAEQFHTKTSNEVQLSVGSSGKLYAQILHGAPFDVFLSADREKPSALEKSGLTVEGTRFTYALGTLALYSSNPKRFGPSQATLKANQYTRLALANPRLAPYGQAAMDVLTSLGLLNATRPKWIQGENVAQTFQFVSTGNADLGFVALSQTDDELMGSIWIIPAELHRPIRQDAVFLARAANNQAAQDFMAFIRSPEANAIMRQFGYRQPLATVAE